MSKAGEMSEGEMIAGDITPDSMSSGSRAPDSRALAGVNAYAGLATADRWVAARRLSVWAEAPDAARHGALIRAYFELALALLEGDEAAERLLGIRGAIRRERIGGLAVEYGVAGGEGGRLRAMLAPYLQSGVATRVVRT